MKSVKCTLHIKATRLKLMEQCLSRLALHLLPAQGELTRSRYMHCVTPHCDESQGAIKLTRDGLGDGEC